MRQPNQLATSSAAERASSLRAGGGGGGGGAARKAAERQLRRGIPTWSSAGGEGRSGGGAMAIECLVLGAGQEVGKSCVVVTFGSEKRVMFDCGMHMGHHDNRRYPDFDCSGTRRCAPCPPPRRSSSLSSPRGKSKKKFGKIRRRKKRVGFSR
uniref:Metallo-beta-lactamase domain-containing protein n=1 Tax=Oryza barthii TaxID=65489 RepID=A0A0D3H6K2_9ORYZ